MENTIEKNKNVRNINRIGKIMKIILRISQVFMVIGFIAVAAGMIILMAVPIDDIRIRPSFHLDVDYNTEDFNSSSSDLKLNNKKYDFDIEGFAVDLYTKTHKIDNKMSTLSVDGDGEEITGSEIRLFVMKKLIVAELFLAAAFVALTFGAKLAKALQKCDTPFSDEIIMRLTRFGKSLIPLGIISLFTSGISTGIVIPLLMLFLFISLFKYGAELQKEADGTV
ncbi:MAG: DUF2975 domain-containing protein [Ruminococcus sp.]|nr:DUF2975 domain-containing protein [Ruminococcus sp.]